MVSKKNLSVGRMVESSLAVGYTSRGLHDDPLVTRNGIL
jgi:hypothetical protein